MPYLDRLLPGNAVPRGQDVYESLLHVLKTAPFLEKYTILQPYQRESEFPWRQGDFCALLKNSGRPVMFGLFRKEMMGAMCMIRTYSDLTLPGGRRLPLGQPRILKLDVPLPAVHHALSGILLDFDKMDRESRTTAGIIDSFESVAVRLLGALPVGCLTSDRPDPFGLADAVLPAFYGQPSMAALKESQFYDKERGTFGGWGKHLTAEDAMNAALAASHKRNPAAVLMGTLAQWKAVPLLAPVAETLLAGPEHVHDVGALIFGTLKRWKMTGFDGAPGTGAQGGARE